MQRVKVTEFTDPGCPFSFSAEPARWRILWRYGDHLDWSRHMVVLSQSPEDFTQPGFGTPRQAAGLRNLQRLHRMPIDARERPRMAATEPACRAIVATRLHAPVLEATILREFRVLAMAGHLLDEPATLERAATASGIVADDLREWMATPGVQAELEADMALARAPSPAALVLEHRLARTETGHRYTCPSYAFDAECGRFEVPGFRPVEAYEVVLANMAPELPLRETPTDVAAVLEWAATPLATAEVAAVCQMEFEQAREELARVGALNPVGGDGYWTVAAAMPLAA